MNYLAVVFIFIFSAHIYSGEFVNCHFKQEYSYTLSNAYKLNCGGPSAYVSPQSIIKDPEFKIIEIILPNKDSTKDAIILKVDNVTYTFDQDYKCDTFECFSGLDHLEILQLENPGFLNEFLKDLPQKNEYNIEKGKILFEIEKSNIHKATPVFSEAPDGLESYFTDVDDIYMHPSLIGILDAEESEPFLKYKEKSTDYLKQFQIFEEQEIEAKFTQEEIAFYENSISLEDEQEDEDYNNRLGQQYTDNFTLGVSINDEDKGKKLDKTLFTVGGKSYVISPLRKELDNTVFRVDENERSQVFSSPDYAILIDNENLAKIEFKNNGLSIVDHFGMSFSLDATPLTAEQIGSPVQNKCLEALNSYLNNKDFSANDVNHFLKLQEELTSYRLALINLSNKNKQVGLKKNILNLIKRKFKEFPQIAKEFDSVSVDSGLFLQKALPVVYDIMSKQTTKDIGSLTISDLKMIDIWMSADSQKIENLLQDIKLTKKYDDKDNLLESERKMIFFTKNLIYRACVEQMGLNCKNAQQQLDRIYNEDLDVIYAALLNFISFRVDTNFLTQDTL